MTIFRACVLAGTVWLSLGVSAATFTVTRTDDRNASCLPADCSLREAVAAANAAAGNDVIEFSLPMPATIELTGPIAITSNVSIEGPGSVHYSLRDQLTIDANSLGRVFTITGTTARIAGLVLTGGSASAIHHTGAGTTLTLDTVRVSGNTGNDGGGVASFFGTLIVRDSTFSTNTAASSGGGIYHEGTQLTVTNSTFNGNVSQIDSDFGGGGIYAEDATTIINSTFSGNSSAYGGGGVNVSTISTIPVVVRNSTFTANTALYGGGLFFAEGNVTLTNSIVALNTATDLPASSNYYEDASLFTATTNYTGATPMLGPLQDNGGPTETHALLVGSPAIDAGSNGSALDENGAPLTTDQRGQYSPRIVGGTVDIGAYEYGALPETSFTVTRTDDRNVACTPGDCSLREAVGAANATPGAQIVDFAPSLLNQTITVTATIAVSTDVLILGFNPDLLTVDRDGSGPIFNVTGTSVVIAGLELTGGTASAIQHTGAGTTLTLDTVRIAGNTANNGGGVSSVFGTLIVRDSTFSNNTATGSGGGIYHEGTQLTVTGSTFNGNVSQESGDFGGGGIYAEDATTITNSTFSGNSSAYGGGAVNVTTFGAMQVVIRNSTFTGNTAVYGGGLFFGEGNVTLANSIVALNTASGLASSNNFYQDASLFVNVSNYTGSAPNLGPLQDNGGPTMTHALLCSSPAWNAGSNAQSVGTYDQRGEGFARLVGTVDIGAYEAQTAPPCGSLLTATKTVTGTFVPGGTVQYTITITNSGDVQNDNAGNEFSDTVPAGVTVTSVSATSGTAANAGNNVTWNGSIAALGSVTITINGTVAAAAGATVSNQGTVSYDADANASNETNGLTDDPGVAGASDPTSFTVLTPTALTATKTVSGAFVPGGAVQYSIVLTNVGGVGQPDNATDEFTDAVPAGVTVTGVNATSGSATNAGNNVAWNGALAPAASVTITIDGTVVAAPASVVTNQGTAFFDVDANASNEASVLTDDPSLPGSTDPTAFTVLGPVAFTATKTVSGLLITGGTVQYTITLTNTGDVAQPDNAGDEFTDAVPAGVTVTSVVATSGTAANVANSVTWNGSLAPDASVTITIDGLIVAAAGSTVSNQGSVTFDADANGTNEASTLTDDPSQPGATDPTSFTVLSPVAVSATKTVAGTLWSGGTVEYTITLTNNGGLAQPDNAGDEFTDVVPAGITVTGVVASSGAATHVGNTVSWNGSIAPAGSVTITINGMVTAAPGVVISNQGSVQYDSTGDGSNESQSPTDDPSLPGSSDATSFTVLAAELTNVPTLDSLALLALIALLAFVAMRGIGR